MAVARVLARDFARRHPHRRDILERNTKTACNATRMQSFGKWIQETESNYWNTTKAYDWKRLLIFFRLVKKILI